MEEGLKDTLSYGAADNPYVNSGDIVPIKCNFIKQNQVLQGSINKIRDSQRTSRVVIQKCKIEEAKTFKNEFDLF